MKNKSQPSMGGFSEYNERTIQRTEVGSARSTSEKQVLLDHLAAMGFASEEGLKLLNMREHLYENTEICQRIADDSRMQFAVWLYKHGEIQEG